MYSDQNLQNYTTLDIYIAKGVYLISALNNKYILFAICD